MDTDQEEDLEEREEDASVEKNSDKEGDHSVAHGEPVSWKEPPSMLYPDFD